MQTKIKQTAVKWLVQQLNIKYGNNDFIITFNNLIEEAEEIEKQQIIDSYRDGLLTSVANPIEESEQYYNETFNK